MTMRRSAVGRVLRRELWTTISRPGFIISTLVLPLLPLLLIFVQGLVDPEKIIGGNEPARVGIVDTTGLLSTEAIERESTRARAPAPLPLPPGVTLPAGVAAPLLERSSSREPDLYLPYESEEAARADLLSDDPGRRLTSYVVVTEAWKATGELEAYRLRPEPGAAAGNPFGTRLGRVIRHGLLEGRVDEVVRTRVLEQAAARNEHVLDATGAEVAEEIVDEDLRRFLVPIMAAMFLSVALFAGAGYLLLGLSEEKENRVLELLLASLTPDELLAGKLVGIGLAGLLQFSVWVLLIAVPAVLLLPMLGLSGGQLAWAALFFLTGYALFGALMLGIGAVADTARHAQQLSGIFTLVAMLPLMFNFVVIQDPSGVFARVLTFFPLTAPITVMLRLSAAPIPLWELAAAVTSLLLFDWLALKGAARLFRISLLLYGNRPTPRQVWRWLRHGG